MNNLSNKIFIINYENMEGYENERSEDSSFAFKRSG